MMVIFLLQPDVRSPTILTTLLKTAFNAPTVAVKLNFFFLKKKILCCYCKYTPKIIFIFCSKVCFVEQDIPSRFYLKFSMEDLILRILFKAYFQVSCSCEIFWSFLYYQVKVFLVIFDLWESLFIMLQCIKQRSREIPFSQVYYRQLS